ncbi:MAG: TetR/AcrR family transcriptional regulator [Actinomycetes bacterium]
MHSTKERLISYTASLLSEKPGSEIKIDQVLAVSGISKGSLYHHFEDFSELVETAQLKLFCETVDNKITQLTKILDQVQSEEEMKKDFRILIRSTDEGKSKVELFNQLDPLCRSLHSERLKKEMRFEQERLTQRWVLLFEECARRGGGKPELNPRAVALLVQGMLMGRLFDEVSLIQVDLNAWHQVVDLVFESLFFATSPAEKIEKLIA